MDLVGTSTVGVCAGLYTLIAFLTSRAAGFFGNDTLGASLAISMGCFLLVEVLYAGFYILSVDVSVIEALGQRALPCALYDCAMALIVLPITTHMFAAAAPSHKAPTSSTVRLR